jgi:hypothetical protein
MLKFIPNFIYTYGYVSETSSLLLEYQKGETFEQYLRGSQFDFDEYLWILVQLALALNEAQEKFCFVHHDLYPWNVLLQRSSITAQYQTHYNRWITVDTACYPIMIDYEKSHCVIENRHYGVVRPFEASRIRDLICIIVSSLSIIVSVQTLSRTDLSKVFHLSSFFSNTGYTQYQTFHNMKSLKIFLSDAKKYANVIDNSFYELETKTPIDFVNFLGHTLQQTKEYQFNMREFSSRSASCVSQSKHPIVDVYAYSLNKHQVAQVEVEPPYTTSVVEISEQSIDVPVFDVDCFNDPTRFSAIYKTLSTYRTQFVLDYPRLKQILVECIQSGHQKTKDIIHDFKHILTLDTFTITIKQASIQTFLELCDMISESNRQIPNHTEYNISII